MVWRVNVLVATRWAKELTPYMTTIPFPEISSYIVFGATLRPKVESVGYAGLPAAKNGIIGLARGLLAKVQRAQVNWDIPTGAGNFLKPMKDMMELWMWIEGCVLVARRVLYRETEV